MRDETSSCDVVFVVQGERFSAHRCLAAAASLYFHALFTNEMKKRRQKEIVLKDVDVDAWRVVLNYTYTARIQIGDVEQAMLYLECANRFGMKELEDVIIPHIVDKLDESDITNVLAMAIRIDCIPLRKIAMETFDRKFYEEFTQSRFVKLPSFLAVECLRSGQLVVRSELDVFTAALRWWVCWEMNQTGSEMNEEVASRACELLVHNQLLSTESGFVELGSRDETNLSELFKCVTLDNLNVTDLQRLGRVCRELSKKLQTTPYSGLLHLEAFS